MCERPPRKWNGHSDLGDGHLFPLWSESAPLLLMGGWRALHVQNVLPDFSLNEQSLLLSVEMGQLAMAANSPFSTYLCHCLVSAREFFHLSSRKQLWGEGSSVTMPLGGCSSGCVTAIGTSLPATAGLRVKKKRKREKKAEQKPPVVPGLLPSCFYFSNLKVREKKDAKCIFVFWQSQDWTFNSSFIHHHQFYLQIWPRI